MTASSHGHIISNPCKLDSFSQVRSTLQGPSPGNEFSSRVIPWTLCNLYTPSMSTLVMDEVDPGGGRAMATYPSPSLGPVMHAGVWFGPRLKTLCRRCV